METLTRDGLIKVFPFSVSWLVRYALSHLSRNMAAARVILKLFFIFLEMVPFLQFKKREKYPWKSVSKSNFHGCFSSFLNCTYGTKLRKASHICLL